MDTRKKFWGFVVAIIVIGGIITIALQHHSSGMQSMSMSSSNSAPDAIATKSVSIQNYEFGPTVIKVKVGDTVTWTNMDSLHHTVTTDGTTDGPSSGDLNVGEKYSFTFKTAGTYKYDCKIHPSMHGMVIVTH